MKNKKKLIISIIIICAVFYVFFRAAFYDTKAYKIGALVGSELPEFSLNIAGEKEQFSNENLLELTTQYKMLNFFASWCSTCLAEHADMMKLAKEENITLIGVIWRDNLEDAKAWLESYGNPYDILLIDRNGSSKFKFGLVGVPESFIINHEGLIISHYRGPINLKNIVNFYLK